MTQEQVGGLTLEFGVADRLRKAREHIHADQTQFAAMTGISRGTIGNYENPEYQTKRKSYIIQQWAMATGVSPQWLEKGTDAVNPQPPGQEVVPAATVDALDRAASKHRPRHAVEDNKRRYAA